MSLKTTGDILIDLKLKYLIEAHENKENPGIAYWCVSDGRLTETNPPLAGFNVTSVTRRGIGDYDIQSIGLKGGVL